MVSWRPAYAKDDHLSTDRKSYRLGTFPHRRGSPLGEGGPRVLGCVYGWTPRERHPHENTEEYLWVVEPLGTLLGAFQLWICFPVASKGALAVYCVFLIIQFFQNVHLEVQLRLILFLKKYLY